MASSKWLCGPITKEEAAAAAMVGGGVNGSFNVRTRPGNEGEYALCVVYKGRPTHHLISPNDDGLLTVNKKLYGEHQKVTDLVKWLSVQRPGWPVPLEFPKGTGGEADGPPAWLKGKISKEDIAESLQPFENGKFAIREHTAPDSWALCVVYKERPTHHLIVFNDDGLLTVNKKPYGGAKTLVELVDVLSQPTTPGWPVQLIVPKVQSKSVSKPTQQSKPKPPAGGGSGGGGAGGVSSDGGYLHAAMSKEEANALITSKGTGVDGNFFVRARGDGFPDEYVMCVIYRGGPTHHLIVKRDNEFFINKKPAGGSKSLDALVEFLKAPGRPSWPVPLKDHVPNGDVVEQRKGEDPIKTVATPASPTPISESTSWLHGVISREEIEAFVAPNENGKFAIRERDDGTLSLCVVYRMKPTHHIIKRVEDHYTINNKRYGNAGTLEEVVEYLSQPNRPGWPVQLLLPTPIPQSPKQVPKEVPKEEEPEQAPPPPRPAKNLPKPTAEEEELPDIPQTSTPKKPTEVESRVTTESPPPSDVGYVDVGPAKLKHMDSNSSIASNSSRISRSSKSDGLASLSNEQLIAHVRALKGENQRLRQLGGRNGSLEDSMLRLQTPNLGRLEGQRDSIELLCTQMATLRANLYAKELDRIQESAWLETQSAQLTSQWSTIQQLEQQHANTNANTGTRSFNEQIDRVRAGIRRLQIFWEGQEESRVKRSEWLRDELHGVHTLALTLQSGLQSQQSDLQKQQTIRMKSTIDNYNVKMAHVQKLLSPAQKLLYFGAGAADC
eukprot:m.166808 g.166808  ORF g.166808 m.166808 type:complete len:781 (-) comp31439_c0_seq2:35-2377(-)